MPRKKFKGSGTTEYKAKLEAEQKAAIWTLTEEGLSQREVGRRLEISPSAVGRELSRDPIGLEALRARQREERSKRWRRIEDLGLDETIAWLERAKSIRQAKKAPSKVDVLVPRFLQAIRHTAETATRQTQLLTGGATSRLDVQDTEGQQNAEQLIEAAIEMGCVDQLPPRLKDRALKVQGERKDDWYGGGQ